MRGFVSYLDIGGGDATGTSPNPWGDKGDGHKRPDRLWGVVAPAAKPSGASPQGRSGQVTDKALRRWGRWHHRGNSEGDARSPAGSGSELGGNSVRL